MAVVLAGASTRQAVPQQEGLPCCRLQRVAGLEPQPGGIQQVAQLRLAELQRLVVLEEHHAVAGLCGK